MSTSWNGRNCFICSTQFFPTPFFFYTCQFPPSFLISHDSFQLGGESANVIPLRLVKPANLTFLNFCSRCLTGQHNTQREKWHPTHPENTDNFALGGEKQGETNHTTHLTGNSKSYSIHQMFSHPCTRSHKCEMTYNCITSE